MAMAAMNMVSAEGVLGVSLHSKRCPQGGRLCTLQENPHFWSPTIKVRQPDGTLSNSQTDLGKKSDLSLRKTCYFTCKNSR